MFLKQFVCLWQLLRLHRHSSPSYQATSCPANLSSTCSSSRLSLNDLPHSYLWKANKPKWTWKLLNMLRFTWPCAHSRTPRVRLSTQQFVSSFLTVPLEKVLCHWVYSPREAHGFHSCFDPTWRSLSSWHLLCGHRSLSDDVMPCSRSHLPHEGKHSWFDFRRPQGWKVYWAKTDTFTPWNRYLTTIPSVSLCSVAFWSHTHIYFSLCHLLFQQVSVGKTGALQEIQSLLHHLYPSGGFSHSLQYHSWNTVHHSGYTHASTQKKKNDIAICAFCPFDQRREWTDAPWSWGRVTAGDKNASASLWLVQQFAAGMLALGLEPGPELAQLMAAM